MYLFSSKITWFLKAESCWYPLLSFSSYSFFPSLLGTYWCTEYEYNMSPCFSTTLIIPLWVSSSLWISLLILLKLNIKLSYSFNRMNLHYYYQQTKWLLKSTAIKDSRNSHHSLWKVPSSLCFMFSKTQFYIMLKIYPIKFWILKELTVLDYADYR